jgi:hypothetical protein
MSYVPDGNVGLYVYVPEELRDAVKDRAHVEGVTLREFVRRAIARELGRAVKPRREARR